MVKPIELHDAKDREPNGKLIGDLETLLGFARSGRLRSMICIAGWDDDSVSHTWAIDPRSGERRMLGGLVVAQHDFTMAILLNDDESEIRKATFQLT